MDTLTRTAPHSPAPQPRIEYLTVSDVSAILAVSDDTILKQFGALDGVIDVGTPATMHRRRKRVLRIPLRTLERFIADKQVKVRRAYRNKKRPPGEWDLFPSTLPLRGR